MMALIPTNDPTAQFAALLGPTQEKEVTLASAPEAGRSRSKAHEGMELRTSSCDIGN